MKFDVPQLITVMWSPFYSSAFRFEFMHIVAYSKIIIVRPCSLVSSNAQMGSCVHYQLSVATNDVAVPLVAYLGAFRISREELLKPAVWSFQLI